jgi:hypothetical protein
MFRSPALRAIASIALLVAAQSLLAQESNPLSPLLRFPPELVIDEITESASQVVVRGTRAEDGARWELVCGTTGQRRGTFIIQDLELKTDDRMGLDSGACDAWLAAARERKEAQRR